MNREKEVKMRIYEQFEKSLSAKETGRIGGLMTKKKKHKK